MKWTKLPKRLLSALLPAVLLLPLAPAQALESDKDQPISIEADSVDLDDRKGQSIYQGNVELSQGSIRIRADRITVSQRKGQPDHILAEGRPVGFRQKADDNKGMITGQARKVEYDANSDVLYLIDSAELTQGKDSFKSDRITYDRAKARIRAGASAKGRERVRVTIGGKQKSK